jgi:hypothetical protein
VFPGISQIHVVADGNHDQDPSVVCRLLLDVIDDEDRHGALLRL